MPPVLNDFISTKPPPSATGRCECALSSRSLWATPLSATGRAPPLSLVPGNPLQKKRVGAGRDMACLLVCDTITCPSHCTGEGRVSSGWRRARPPRRPPKPSTVPRMYLRGCMSGHSLHGEGRGLSVGPLKPSESELLEKWPAFAFPKTHTPLLY